MKKLLLTITSLVVTLFALAQAPNLINYQGVARNAAGNVLPNQSIGLRLSILNGSPSGPSVYSETRTVLTNAFGLFNVQVGSTTGGITGVNWTSFGAGSGTKYLLVELDPNGGSSYVNVGSTQILSVPYALYAAAGAPVGPAGGDLTGTYPNPQIFFPLLKTFNASTFPNPNQNRELIGMTNSATTGTLGAIQGTSASTDGAANAITGTMSSTAPGSFSAGLRGVNNGTGGLGIGVYGSQNGSGWGVYGTTPSGIGLVGIITGAGGYGVWGQANTGIGVYGTSGSNSAAWFQNTNAANTANIVDVTTNGTGNGISSINTGTGRGGYFQVNNAASTANAIEAITNGTGASWGIRSTSTGTNGAGLFVQSNTANTANNVFSNQAGLGRAGLFQTPNVANTADALTAITNSTNTGVAAEHGINGASGLTIAAKLGNWGESDNGVGSFGTSSTGIGVYGATNTSGTGVVGFSIGGNAANFFLQAPNNSNVVVASTTGNGNVVNATTSGSGSAVFAATSGTFRAATIANTNAANTQITELINNNNTSSTGYANGSLTSLRGAGGLGNTFLWTGTSTSVTGIAASGIANAAGIGVQGTSENEFGVAGLSTTGIGVRASSITTGTGLVAESFGTGYAVQTAGRLQFSGQGAAINRIMGATNAAGDATWRTAASLGIISVTPAGGGTLNYVTKFTPDGFTIGNSQIFDNGTAVGIGTNTPGAGLVVSGNGIWNSAIGIQNTASGMEWRMNVQGTTWQVTKIPGSTFTPFQLFADGQVEFPSTAGATRLHILDNGNVGIGTSTPGAKLHVSNAGADGILTKSTAGFTVNDIDAANGDAALRFFANGTSQWNIRNRPTDNYLEIFEMGQDSRMVIQDGTGNVGIGETTTNNPAYKLDVNATNNGNNGIRVKNTASFATVDIIGATTDQAVRFGRNGSVFSGLNTGPDGNHINFFKFGAGDRMALNVNTGNLGIGTASPFNAVSKVQVSGFDATNNTYASSTGFLGATGLGVKDAASSSFEKWGIHSYVNGGTADNIGIFGEPGTTASTNVGVFGRVSTAPAGGNSYAMLAFDAVNNGTTTWAAYIAGRMRYQDGTQGAGKLLISNISGDASWSTAAAAGLVSGSGTLNYVPKWTPNGTTLGNSLIIDNGTNVGINNSNPTQLLHMGNGGNPILKIEGDVNSGAQGAHIRMTETFPSDYGWDIFSNGASDELSFNGIQANAITDPNILVVKRFPTTGVGINTSPTAKLDVNGNFRLTDGTQGAGKILTSDASGFASWQDNTAQSVGISMRGFNNSISVPASTLVPITQWAVIDNEDGGANYNNVTGEYTITKNGVYQVNAAALWNGFSTASNFVVMYVYVNGGYYTEDISAAKAGDIPNNHVNFSKRFNAGDKVRCYLFQNTGSTQSTQGLVGTNSLSVQYLHN